MPNLAPRPPTAASDYFFIRCRQLRVAVFVLVLLLSSHAPGVVAAEMSDPVVTVSGGQIRGRMLPGGNGVVFRGVPFAQPPVGERRWREPQPVAPWSGVRDAAASGPPCAQPRLGWNDHAADTGSEDCLYLDVWAPNPQPDARRPVMVWIHGGGNVAGAGGTDPLYDGRAFVRHDVVLVVIQYRLGVLGFLAHPELTRESSHHASGNYGILDQIAALEWVRDNFARFGGDPHKVTVFGQSAGATDTLLLLTSPRTKGLIHRAIAESAAVPLGAGFPSLADAEQKGVRLGERVKVSAEHPLQDLRTKPVAELLQAATQGPDGFGGGNVDGWVFVAPPVDTFARGRELGVPLLLGSNAREFPADISAPEQRRSLQQIFGELAPRALALYDQATPDPRYGDRNDQWGGDVFRCPAMVVGGWHRAAGHPTWEYQFDRAIPPRPDTAHSSELPYVFGNLYAEGSQGGAFQPADHQLSAIIQSYWTTFARMGDPNGAAVPAWPQYDEAGRQSLEFTRDAGVIVTHDQRGPFCDLFREAMKKSVASQ